MRVALISDTHLPRGARRVPDACTDELRRSDLIVHAGDFARLEVLGWLEGLGPEVRAVHGNVDEPRLRERLPERIELDLPAGRLAVVHDAGPAPGRAARLRRLFPRADAVVFGHSHMPLHEREPSFQIFNPGSPTERRRAPRHSFGLLEAGGESLEFQHVWL